MFRRADATVTHLNLFGLNQTDGEGNYKGSAVSTAVIALTDEIKINDVLVGATKLNTARAKAAAINEISDQTGVTATGKTTLLLDFNFGDPKLTLHFQ